MVETLKIEMTQGVIASLKLAQKEAEKVDAINICVTVAVPAVAGSHDNYITSFLDLWSDGQIVWLPNDNVLTSQNGWKMCGLGTGLVVDAGGTDRFESIKNRATQLFDNLLHLVDQSIAEPPSVRFFGSAAFAEKESKDCSEDSDAEIVSASFAVPAWQYLTNGKEAVVRFCAISTFFKDENNWLSRAEKIEEWLAAEPLLTEYVVPKTAIEITDDDYDYWSQMVSQALKDIDDGVLDKVVVARASQILGKTAFSLSKIIAAHQKNYPDCVRFAVSPGDVAFTGVTPEQLVTVHDGGHTVEADALAGSIPAGNNSSVNLKSETGDTKTETAFAEQLLASYKNRREFDFVLHNITARFDKMNIDIGDNIPLRVKKLKNIYHLHSHVKGRSRLPVHVLDAVALLHPTPAVCGTPTNIAAEWLKKNEMICRGWYAGPVGWFDENGEGDFWVAIRSAAVRGKLAVVFAGCGIVKGADIREEYKETLAKQQPMFEALGVADRDDDKDRL